MVNKTLLEASDVISFHDYESIGSVKKQAEDLKKRGRPVFCTEYLSRSEGSRFETVMLFFRDEKAVCFNWGLLAGKAQTIYPWNKPGDGREPAVWFHDIYRKDGTPFSRDEVELIRKVTGGDR